MVGDFSRLTEDHYEHNLLCLASMQEKECLASHKNGQLYIGNFVSARLSRQRTENIISQLVQESLYKTVFERPAIPQSKINRGLRTLFALYPQFSMGKLLSEAKNSKLEEGRLNLGTLYHLIQNNFPPPTEEQCCMISHQLDTLPHPIARGIFQVYLRDSFLAIGLLSPSIECIQIEPGLRRIRNYRRDFCFDGNVDVLRSPLLRLPEELLVMILRQTDLNALVSVNSLHAHVIRRIGLAELSATPFPNSILGLLKMEVNSFTRAMTLKKLDRRLNYSTSYLNKYLPHIDNRTDFKIKTLFFEHFLLKNKPCVGLVHLGRAGFLGDRALKIALIRYAYKSINVEGNCIVLNISEWFQDSQAYSIVDYDRAPKLLINRIVNRIKFLSETTGVKKFVYVMDSFRVRPILIRMPLYHDIIADRLKMYGISYYEPERPTDDDIPSAESVG